MRDIMTEINYHRQQLEIVRSEAGTANQILNMKLDETRGRYEFEHQKISKKLDSNDVRNDTTVRIIRNEFLKLTNEGKTMNSR